MFSLHISSDTGTVHPFTPDKLKLLCIWVFFSKILLSYSKDTTFLECSSQRCITIQMSQAISLTEQNQLKIFVSKNLGTN